MRSIFLIITLVIFNQNLFAQTNSNLRNETVRIGIGAGWTGYNDDGRFQRVGLEYEWRPENPKSRHALLAAFDYGTANLKSIRSNDFYQAELKNYKLDLSIVKTVLRFREWGKFGLGTGVSAYRTELNWTDSTFQRRVSGSSTNFELDRQTRNSLTINRLGMNFLTTFDVNFTNGLTIGFRGVLLIKFNRDDQNYADGSFSPFGGFSGGSTRFGSHADRTLLFRIGKNF